MKPIAVLLCLSVAFAGRSQKNERIYNQSFEPVVALSINNDFNLNDWYFGISAGMEDLGYQWGARLGFMLRPIRKPSQIRKDGVIRQYQERKYLLSLDLDKRFLHFDVGDQLKFQVFGGVKTGVLLGDYFGTRASAEPVFVLAPMGGVCLNFNDKVLIKAGYMLLGDRLENVSDSRVTLSCTFALGEDTY